MEQRIIDKAVNIATRAALNNSPVDRVIWIPPQTAASDPDGSFLISYAQDLDVADTLPWS